MLRALPSSGFFGFMTAFRKDFLVMDKSYKGISSIKDVRGVFSKYNGDLNLVEEILKPFCDAASDAIYWVELVGFIASCSIWFTMRRLHSLDGIRKKQGKK
jgi:hypothetical protein